MLRGRWAVAALAVAIVFGALYRSWVERSLQAGPPLESMRLYMVTGYNGPALAELERLRGTPGYEERLRELGRRFVGMKDIGCTT
jgi:hypothetical protein